MKNFIFTLVCFLLSLSVYSQKGLITPDGIEGYSDAGNGVYGQSNNGIGAFGYSTNGYGLYGFSNSGFGIKGVSSSNHGIVGSSTSGWGVYGYSFNNDGIYGLYSGSSATGKAIHGVSATGYGIYGEGVTGVYGTSTGATAILGKANTSGIGVSGNSDNGTGVYGFSTSGSGVYGNSLSGDGVYGKGTTHGIYGISNSYGVFGDGNTEGTGVYGQSLNGAGVSAFSTSGYALFSSCGSGGYAGVFSGTVYAQKVGIGTLTPLAPLHVAASASLTNSTTRYFSYGTGTTVGVLPNGSYNVGLLVDYDIVTKNSFVSAQTVTTSDARIKKIIGLSHNQQDLAKVRQIQITDYRYKDVVTWGNQTFKKVIAQQVEEVYPQAVKKMTSTIPDIYSLAEKVVYGETNKTLTVSLSKNYEIRIDDKIEFIHEKQGKVQAIVESVSGNSFTVKDWQYPTDKIFVYGREVNDFRSVDYEAISMLGISAIQQLAKENEELVKEIKSLKANSQQLNARLEALETLLPKPQTGK